ncbi:trypsin 3A1-like [Pseudomyrmex gracilis]|uniref:trypsin 3A1-like n=1 Tax=Pseudomyrmex gracilis TaxID=219809 RepID=UPI000994D0A3|nr:trypsin 3A1-like [Pseudomyrmex gracilis]XP_020290688.1 trypsin 3A1-like [Pseudomyrmex gracilis]
MHGAIIILYFVVETIGGHATHVTPAKIIGGQPIDIKHRPFMLSLHNSQGFLCGASILRKSWSITALHCLDTTSPTKYYVRAGSNKTNTGGSVHKVTKIYVYNDSYISSFSSVPYHDIALIKVSPPFCFSRNIAPIRLQFLSTEPRLLFISGWGQTEKEKKAKTLMSVRVRHVPYETCIKTSSIYANLVRKDNHLCYGTRGHDACYGDSGGPLTSWRTLFGIVSFGVGCGKVTGVYVKVSYYQTWIRKVILGKL